MAKNTDNLLNAKNEKYAEFYTLYEDIEKEMNEYYEYNKNVFRDKTILLPCDDPEWSNFTKYFVANFNRFGLKKLISTSYANDKKPNKKPCQLSLFELESPDYDETKTNSHGKIYTLTRRNRNVNKDDLKWKYLEGDGDFRSDEVKALRDEADIIITNPPFSLFREFFAWILEANKQFLVISDLGSVAYKEIFPHIKANAIWLGATRNGTGSMWFMIPNDAPKKKGQKIVNGQKYQTIGTSIWLTNIDHGKRHERIRLMTEADNLKYNKSLINKLPRDEEGKPYYLNYDNYPALEVPIVEAIPSDYDGIVGVPTTFLSKYNPEQFEIIGIGTGDSGKSIGVKKNYRGRTDISYTIDGVHKCPFSRILIRKKAS